MSFKFAHNNFNVLDLDKSLDFYEKALGLLRRSAVRFLIQVTLYWYF